MRKSGSAPVTKSSDGRPYLNYSQIAEWLKCRYRWHLGVRRHIQTRAVMRAPELGSMVHAGMAVSMQHVALTRVKGQLQRSVQDLQFEATMLAHDAIAEYAERGIELRGGRKLLQREEVDMFDNLVEQSIGIVCKQLSLIDFQRYETVLKGGKPVVETAVTMPMEDPESIFAAYHATVDWVLIDRELGAVFNADYKVRKAYTPEHAEEVNLQQTMYQRLLAYNGIPTDGTIMFQVKAQPPREPELLASGKGLSRAAIVTDWETYEATLRKHGFDPADYEDMKPKLDAVEWNRIEYTYRSAEESRSIWERVVVPAAREIWQSKNLDQRAWNFMACNGCWARTFCLSEVRSEDLSFLLETQYVDMENPRNRVVLSPDDFVFVDG